MLHGAGAGLPEARSWQSRSPERGSAAWPRLSDAADMNNSHGRLARNLGLALGSVAAIIWLQGALAAAIIILLAAILYRARTARA